MLRWIPIAAGALAGALLAGGVQQYHVMSAQRALSDARSDYMAQVTDAQAAHVLALAEARRIDAAATAKERELQAQVDATDKEAHDAQIQYDVAIAAAAGDRERLLDAVAAAEDGAGHCDAAGANTGTPGKRPAAGLAKLFAELDGLAQASAVAADGAIVRGLRCEVAYDAARAIAASR